MQILGTHVACHWRPPGGSFKRRVDAATQLAEYRRPPPSSLPLAPENPCFQTVQTTSIFDMFTFTGDDLEGSYESQNVPKGTLDEPFPNVSSFQLEAILALYV